MAKHWNSFVDAKTWNITRKIKAYLDPLKYKQGEKTWQKKQKGMEVLYEWLNGRSQFHLVMDKDVMNQFVKWVIVEENWDHLRKTKKLPN